MYPADESDCKWACGFLIIIVIIIITTVIIHIVPDWRPPKKSKSKSKKSSRRAKVEMAEPESLMHLLQAQQEPDIGTPCHGESSKLVVVPIAYNELEGVDQEHILSLFADSMTTTKYEN